MKIYGLSDIHGLLDGYQIPKCDLLLIAGDIHPDIQKRTPIRRDPSLGVSWMNQGFFPLLRPFLEDGWVKRVVITWGNHDWTQGISKEMYYQMPSGVDILVDEEITINGVRIWGSPWSNSFRGWAWMKDPEKLRPIYQAIPEGVDIILSHQPPACGAGRLPAMGEQPPLQLGSVELIEEMRRIKPKAVVCGHIHAGHGVYDVEGVKVYNVAVVDEAYRPVNEATEIIL